MDTKSLVITDRDQIRKEWEKTKEDVDKDIEIIKEWLKTQKHLPEIPTENMIEFFLVNCKFSIEKTKQNLDMYYTVRSLIPDLYRNSNPCVPAIEKAYNTAYASLLPNLTPSLHRVTVYKYKDVDSDKADLRGIISHTLSNIYEIRIHEDLAIGDIYLVDCEHIKIGVAAKLTPLLLKQCGFVLQKVHSSRVQAIHFYKAPDYFHKVITMFKAIANKKIGDRVQTHQTIEELTKHIPLEMLPSNYGGKEKSLDELEALWKQKMFDYKDRFDQLDNMKVDEDLRPEKLQNDELLGYYGNFKKIDTD